MADQEEIFHKSSIRNTQLDNGLRGLVDEVGEIASVAKKHIEYGQPLDELNLLEEIGDAVWRLAQIADAVGFTLGMAMDANIAKLQIRYPNKFTNELAEDANRQREEEGKAVQEFLRHETGTDPISPDPDLMV